MDSESFTALLNCCCVEAGIVGSAALVVGSSHSTLWNLSLSSHALHALLGQF